MRICLTVHGFPPFERTGVENYTRSLAASLVRAGHVVEVFAPCPPGDLPNLALRREIVDGVGVNWLGMGREPQNPEEMLNPPGIATRFGAFLDRERPDVVHFQHVVKLGTGLIGEACKRKIPTIYTAHDYYAHCHRYTLLRPDLKRCETIGDPKACARCDQALAVLNEIEGLGDYQMGVRPEGLKAAERDRLEAALDGRTVDAGFTIEDQEASQTLRKKLDERRLEDFSKLNLLLAPTLFLRDRLIDGGLEPS
ncbi:MAG: glycosyltransferase involved in cell wall biosynthesis, partial [Planctomycetota bacterium]